MKWREDAAATTGKAVARKRAHGGENTSTQVRSIGQAAIQAYNAMKHEAGAKSARESESRSGRATLCFHEARVPGPADATPPGLAFALALPAPVGVAFALPVMCVHRRSILSARGGPRWLC